MKAILLITLILITVQFAAAQLPPDSEKGFTQPAARVNLKVVAHPDISATEPDVRRQITELQKSLMEAAGDNVPPEKLAAAFGSLGEIYQTYSFFEAARECYVNARILVPSEFRWIYLAARAAQQQEKPAEALELFGIASKLRADYLPLVVITGNLLLEQNNSVAAEVEFKRALLIDPGSAAALYGLGQVELSRRNYSIAAVYFEKVLELVPDANRVYYSLALAYRGLKQNDKMSEALALQGQVGVRARDPLFDSLTELRRGVRLHLSRAKTAFEADRFEEAAAEYLLALEAEPDNVTARVNLGAVFAQLKKPVEAIGQFREAIRIAPANINARFNLGLLLSLTQKNEEALTQFEEIVKLAPNDAEAREQMARQFLVLGRADDALAEFTRVVELNPDAESAMIEQVRLLMQKNRYSLVKDILEKSHARFPSKGRTVEILALFLITCPQLDLRDGPKAVELAGSAFRSTGSIEHGVLVAMAYAQSAQCAEAAKWQQAMIAKAIAAGDQEVVDKLKVGLSRYETEVPCGP